MLCSKVCLLLDYRENDQVEWLDIFLIGLMICSTIGPWIIMSCAIYFRFDPTFFVCEDIFGSSTTRSFASKVGTTIIRAVLVTGTLEASRTLTLCGAAVAVSINRLQKSVSTIELRGFNYKTLKSFQNVFTFYAQLRLVYNELATFIQDVSSITISGGFWALVVCMFLVIEAHDVIPFFMYMLVVPFALVLCMIINLALRMICNISETCENIGQICKIETGMAKRKMTTRQKEVLELCKKVKAMHPIQIAYKPFLKVDRGFTCSIWENCAERGFDAMLIF